MLPARLWPAFSVVIMLYLPIEAQARQQDAETTGPMLKTAVTVVDETGKPIEGATIKVNGLRPNVNPGALHAAWTVDRGPAPVAKTNSEGKAWILYPKFVIEDMLTGAISFRVTHPDYVAYSHTNYPVDGPREPIRLQCGAILQVRGFVDQDGSRRILEDIFALARATTGLVASGRTGGWAPQRDGWLETTRLPPGGVLVMLACFPSQGRALFSRSVAVWLARQRVMKQELKLSPGTRLEGRLDDSVPRPVRNGVVIAHCFRVQAGVTEPFLEAFRSFCWSDWTDVSEDGTFVFDSLPMDRVELIALCDGYRSKSPDAAKRSVTIARPQTLFLTSSIVQVELETEQTAIAEIRLTNPVGEPVSGAQVGFAPNVRWNDRASTIFGSKPSRTRDVITTTTALDDRYRDQRLYTSKSDEEGVAVVKNLPAGRITYSIKHNRYTLPGRPVFGNLKMPFSTIELEAGKRTVANVVLIEKGADTPSGPGDD